MISVNFAIRNPFSQRFKNLWHYACETPFKHKFIETEVYADSSLLSIRFDLTARQSHAGVNFEIGVLGYCFQFNFYDNRHWNYTEGRWMVYSEEEGMH